MYSFLMRWRCFWCLGCCVRYWLSSHKQCQQPSFKGVLLYVAKYITSWYWDRHFRKQNMPGSIDGAEKFSIFVTHFEENNGILKTKIQLVIPYRKINLRQYRTYNLILHNVLSYMYPITNQYCIVEHGNICDFWYIW